MTGCERLSDRMPGVALHRSVWSAEEESHLAACADCRTEWELIRIAARLGDSLPQQRDPAAIAAGVLGRVANARSTVRPRRRLWITAGLAAAAVAIIVVRIPKFPVRASIPAPIPVATGQAPTAAGSASQSLPIPELDGLPVSQLESILGALDAAPDASSSLDGPAFDDMGAPELDRALADWEG